MLSAATFTEDFSTNPIANGWKIFGNTNLFHWDSTNQNLRVTWDSSQTNSYFHRPLGTILTRDDDFSLSFDLKFDDYTSGADPNRPWAFPASIGFLNLDPATQTNFSRGAGTSLTYGPINLVEFAFFPSFGGFSPTISQVIVSRNHLWLFNHDNQQDMTPGDLFHVAMNYVGVTQTLTTSVTLNGAPYGDPQLIKVTTNEDFRVAAVSVSSYSHQHADGSILAHGAVDNLVVTTPPPPVENLSGLWNGAQWQVKFVSRTNWLYTLERTTHFITWEAATVASAGNDSVLTLTDTNPPASNTYYRVRAIRP